MDIVLMVAWIGILALQLADITLSAAGVSRAQNGSLDLLDELQDAVGQRRTPEQVSDYRARLAELQTAAEPAGGQLTPTGWLWRRTPVRLIPAALALLAVILLLICAWSPVLLALLVAPAVSYLLALAASRAGLAASAEARVVGVRQRREIEALIEEAAKTSRKKTAGLGDRVARALQILREQQAGRP